MAKPEGIPFLDLFEQYKEIKTEIDDAIQQVINESAFVGGRFVAEFECRFSEYVAAGSCVGVGNGTDAIEIALEALGLPPGSEVIVPSNSFIASSEAVTRAGLQVRFADIDTRTFVLDPDDVAARLTGKTSAIMAVHLYGYPAPLGELGSFAEEHGIALIEDAAQAHGTLYKGKPVGAYGKVGTFSFYPGKNLGAYGDAGALVTSDGGLAEKARMIANHGRIAKYDHEFEGRNSRLDGLQAAILAVKLRHLEEWTTKRRTLAERYQQGLRGVGDLLLPVESVDCRHAYHLYVVRSSHRDELKEWLSTKGIRTGIHYPTALPRLSAYANHPQHNEPFRAGDVAPELLSLPMGDSLTESQIDEVVDAVREFFGF